MLSWQKLNLTQISFIIKEAKERESESDLKNKVQID